MSAKMVSVELKVTFVMTVTNEYLDESGQPCIHKIDGLADWSVSDDGRTLLVLVNGNERAVIDVHSTELETEAELVDGEDE